MCVSWIARTTADRVAGRNHLCLSKREPARAHRGQLWIENSSDARARASDRPGALDKGR